MQSCYIGNSLLGDELAIAQQLISDILTCFGADVLDRGPLAAEAPYMGASCRPMGRQEVPYSGAQRSAPQGRKCGALLKKIAPPPDKVP